MLCIAMMHCYDVRFALKNFEDCGFSDDRAKRAKNAKIRKPLFFFAAFAFFAGDIPKFGCGFAALGSLLLTNPCVI